MAMVIIANVHGAINLMRVDSLPLARACMWCQIAPKVRVQSIAEMIPIISEIVISPEYV